MAFFDNIESVEELKKEYKHLSKELHPDKGGNAEKFKDMVDEYAEKLDELTTIPEFLKDEYIALGKSLCGIYQAKKPEQYRKMATATNAISMLLGLADSRQAKNIKNFIERLEL